MSNKYQMHEILNSVYEEGTNVLKVQPVEASEDGTILPKVVSTALYNQALDSEQVLELDIENYSLVDMIINASAATDIKIYFSDNGTNWLLYKQVNANSYNESVLTAFRYVKVVVGPTSGATADMVLCAKRW